MSNERSYHCTVCGWRGVAEPSPGLDDATCPNCGCLMMPLSWLATWGVALGIAAAVIVLAFFFIWMMLGR